MSQTPLQPYLLARLDALAKQNNLSVDEMLHALLERAEMHADIQAHIDHRTMLNNMADGYLIVNQGGEVLHLHENRLSDKLAGQGITPEAPLADLMRDYVQDGFRNYYEDALQTQQPREFIDYNRYLRRWMQNWVFPHGDVLHIYYRDVTEQVQQEQQLLISEQRLRWLIDHIPVIVYTIDKNGIFTSSAGKSLAKLGLEEDEVVGQSVFELYKDFPDIIDGIHQVLAGESVHVVGDVAGVPFESWYIPQWGKNENVIGMMGIAVDLTEQRRIAEAEQQQARLKAELAQSREMNELKTRFMKMVSHEFRTPLSVIHASAEILQRYAEQLDTDRRKHHLKKITGQVKGLQRVIEDVEQALAIHINPPQPYPELLMVVNIVGQVVQSYRRQHGPRIQYIVEGIPRPVYADHHMLHRMTENLLNNALAYSPDKSPIHVRQTYNRSVFRLTVRDNGMGISEDDQKHIFEPFFRGNNADIVPGTGLGLSLVQHVVEAHAGHIHLHSHPDEGTTIHIYLPCTDLKVRAPATH